MPKISVHLEADSAEEFQALLAMFNAKSVVDADENWLRRETAAIEYPEYKSPEPVTAEPEPAVTPPVTVAPEEPVKTRKPRGPNKPKPATVTAEVTPAPAVQPPVEAPSVSTPEPQASVASRQDLLDAFAEYVQRYGASFGYSDVSKLLQTTFGDGVRKASDVTDANIPVAIGAIRTALADNPYNRKRDYA